MANPAPGSNQSTDQVAAYTHNAVDSGSDLQGPPQALDMINMPAARQEPTGTGPVRPPHSMAGVFAPGRYGGNRSDCDAHGPALASLIGATPSGEVTDPNPPDFRHRRRPRRRSAYHPGRSRQRLHQPPPPNTSAATARATTATPTAAASTATGGASCCWSSAGRRRRQWRRWRYVGGGAATSVAAGGAEIGIPAEPSPTPPMSPGIVRIAP